MKLGKKKIQYLSKVIDTGLIDSMKKYRVARDLDMLGISVNLDTLDVDTETLRFIYKVVAAHIVSKHRGEDGEVVTTVQRKVSDVGSSIVR